MDSSGKRDVERPIDVKSSGVKLEMEIVNQYGQLMGDFSKLDDELWLSKPDDEEGIAFCREGLDWNIVSNDPHEHISDVQLSEYADNSRTDGGGMTSMENNSASLTESSLNQCRTVSPISVLHQKRSFSNEIPYVLKGARTRHPANDGSHFVLDDTTDSCSGSLVKTRKITDLLQLNSVENSNLEASQLMKKCLHCDSVKTPQWRDGPLGRKTLCNACGLQYKKGLLSDGNRPLGTVKPPIQVFKKCLHCESIDTPQWRDGPLGRKTLCNACGIQYRKGLLSPDYQPARTIRFDPYRKKVQEMVTVENSEIDHDSEKFVGDESGITGDMVDSDADRDPDFRPILRRKSKLPKVKDKMCVHCKSTKTPQWREGPLGRKTLNACGVKYKNRLLFPNYQPVVKTPRFDPYERNVREMVIGLSCIRKENTIKTLTGETTDKLDINPDFKPIPRKFQLPNVEDKKCADCGSTETPQWREGPLGHKTLCNACGVQYKKGSLSLGCLPNRTRILDPYEKEVLDMAVVENTDINLNCTREENTIVDMTGETNDMLDSDPDPDPKLDPDFKPIPASKLKLPYVKHKKCAHCESTKTPQWREGPLGRKTLCNACGVQFRQGRLFPEYRPLLSPTYDPSLHSHLPKRVEQMRLRKLREEGEASGNVDQLV